MIGYALDERIEYYEKECGTLLKEYEKAVESGDDDIYYSKDWEKEISDIKENMKSFKIAITILWYNGILTYDENVDKVNNLLTLIAKCDIKLREM